MNNRDLKRVTKRMKDRHSGVEFEAEGHTYTHKGIEYPSVTTIIADSGYDEDFRHVSAEVMEESRQRGAAVHMACHFLTQNDLAWDTVPDSILPYVKAYDEWRRTNDFIAIWAEQTLVNLKHGFAGTPDLVGTIPARPGSSIRDIAIVDIKTSKPVRRSVAVQLAGYDDLIDDAGNARRFSLRLGADGKFQMKEYKRIDLIHHDRAAWYAALTTWNYKRRNGIVRTSRNITA